MSAHDAADLAEIARLVARVEDLIGKVQNRAIPLGHCSGLIESHAMMSRVELMRRPRPPMPDPRLVRRILRQRRLRDRYFESELFADPAWDILLDLTVARAEHRRVSVTSLCTAAAVSATTALRWITMMTEMGLLVSQADGEDKRRRYIALSDSAADAMARYFDELGSEAARLT